jgi:hypothetical protein
MAFLDILDRYRSGRVVIPQVYEEVWRVCRGLLQIHLLRLAAWHDTCS